MILLWLVGIPAIGGLLAWAAGRSNPRRPRWVALAAMTADCVPAVILALRYPQSSAASSGSSWLSEFSVSWIPPLGIRFVLAVDGLSLVLVLLTVFLGLMAVVSAWDEIEERPGFFYFNLLWVLSGITGVFLAIDLFLFYFFWEMMLVPMYLIVAVWGHENRTYAATKFFLFTQISGLLMLVAILALYFIHGRATGDYSFDYRHLLDTPLSPAAARWMMLGFMVAFAVKLPAFPLHTWLPDAHTQAPTAGSVVLAGLLLKTGAYGMLRFVIPLFSEAARDLSPIAVALAVAGVLYGALMAFAQNDLKRLVAYTSVSHMGFVLLGIFVFNETALQGALVQMIAHGVSTGALFMLAGALQRRTGTRDMRRMGGLWRTMPKMGAAMLFFAVASLGLPGFGNFVGEFLVLLGAYSVSVSAAVLGALGLVGASIYALSMMQRSFHGEPLHEDVRTDLSKGETAGYACMAVAILWLGLFPQWVIGRTDGPLRSIKNRVAVEKIEKPGDRISGAQWMASDYRSAANSGNRP